jgi:hypothetical protein
MPEAALEAMILEKARELLLSTCDCLPKRSVRPGWPEFRSRHRQGVWHSK